MNGIKRISKVHKLIWGCLPPWVLACAGKWRWLGKEVGRAREVGRGPRCRASSGEIRRTPAMNCELRRQRRTPVTNGERESARK
jgi:hypothetical protein